MDADVERAPPAFDDDEEWDGTEEMRKRKLEEYMDEVYGLDFNDMVGGMPTRFHYARVDSQTFGLSPAEILMATDAELNTFMGIKKYAPYRKEGKGRTWDAQRGARLKELKDTLKERGARGSKAVDEQAVEKAKKRKGKKERMREKAAAAAAAGGEDGAGEELEAEVAEVAEVVDGAPKEKRRKRKLEEEEKEADEAEEPDDDAADGAEGALRKKKRRRQRKTAAAVSA
uniref:43kDa secreted glycoprotein (Immunodominant antigen Gp43) n=1 Tax=Ganoderma boninense TaxID=34458 RepID=A0A5K1K0K2_9APHY